MEKNKLIILNKIYLVFLIIVWILIFVFSFKTGTQMYYLVNTNLNDKNTPINSDVASWKFEVLIEY